jgi:hypothetical protein
MAIKYYIGVVSLEHAKIGYKNGFTQACHDKKYPLSKMKKNDWFCQYSPKLSLQSQTPYQKFSYIGKVSSEDVYQVDVNKDFQPYRI